MLLTNLIDHTKEHYGEYPFLYYKDKTYTNLEVEKMAKKFSILLRNHDIADGERVVVSIPNCPEVIFAYQGILRSRSIVIPVMHLLHPREIHFILNDSKAKAIITSSQVLPNMIEASKDLAYKPIFIVVDQLENKDVFDGYEIIELYKEIETIENSHELLTDAQESDTAVILYTSGTTGRPKGVMLTHKNLYSSAMSAYELLNDREDAGRGTTLGVLPLAHVYGFTMMNSCFLLGSSVVIFPKFDVDRVFACIEKYNVRAFSAVPAMLYAMVSSPNVDQYDLSSLESVGSGSAALPVAVIHAFKQKFNAEIREGYGLSEAAPTVAAHREGMPIKPGSVGVAIPGVQVRVVDENVTDVPKGEIGELIVKGDNITTGYYGLEEATKKAIKDGWLFTGDLATMDNDEYLYIVDRKNDLIIRGGFNIYPRDLEEVIMSHEAVAEVAVIGIPDERIGEEIVACVVKNPGSIVSEVEIIAYSQQKLAKYKTPKRVVFLQQLPRNGVGKILKRKLREMYETTDFSFS
ncbi:long-chain fatty acid--CoA ligase [Peribacillus cavernae]|uniref:Long-chain fatty acid--CoA ligase n=1 Tax=Peribacillus cavernae TaxID=1674310 RepID=A0A3S0U1C2_9BACI|nr:AMP-binding protein [Peribacillus cavernae]MDQ0217705.1 long-chain acyl-CoA synthetase [Peribacillus cavernae]RUQ28173.1 long-chain fatty acid--CoA ligase [Peribacillus cavernae]